MIRAFVFGTLINAPVIVAGVCVAGPVYVSEWGPQTPSDGNRLLTSPSDVAVDSAGNVYVTDTGESRVAKFDYKGTLLLKWGASGSGNGEFHDPTGIATSSTDDVYVVDADNYRVQRFDTSGNFVGAWGSFGTGDGQFSFSDHGAVAVAPNGDVYVVDPSLDRVQRFNSSGGFLGKWGSFGTGDGQFHSPRGVGVDNDGNVHVSDGFNYRIQKFAPDGTFITEWGSRGSNPGQFRWHNYIETDSLGNLYVQDIVNQYIQKFDSSGTYLGQFGNYAVQSCCQAQGVAVHSTGNIYVIDRAVDVVQRWFDGESMAEGETATFDNLVVWTDTDRGNALSIGTNRTVSVSDTTNIQTTASLSLGGGTLNTDRLIIDSGGELIGGGSILGRVSGGLGAEIFTTGALEIGDATKFDGFNHQGNLTVGAHAVTIHSAGFAPLGTVTTLAGGSLTAANGVSLGIGSNLLGTGAVNAKVAASVGSIIAASGPLTIGDAGSVTGFVSDGEMRVDGHMVTVEDSNGAVLGALTTIGSGGAPGTLGAANGLVVGLGRNVVGHGTLDTPDDPLKPLINYGNIEGDSIDDPIMMSGYVKGIGTFSNFVSSGTFAPGNSTVALNMGNGTYSATNTLEIEIDGASAGAEHDQLNHVGVSILGGTLKIMRDSAFTPGPGQQLTIITATGGVQGMFQSILGAAISPEEFLKPIYGPNEVVLTRALYGDMDVDGNLDFDDIAPFVFGLMDTTGYLNQFGLLPDVHGDIDGNGMLDFDDIDDFVNLLSADLNSGGHPVPEPSGLELVATGALATLLALLLCWARPLRLARHGRLSRLRAISTMMV